MNKKLILVFGLLIGGVFAAPTEDVQSMAMVKSLAKGLSEDEVYEPTEGFDDHSIALVPYQAPRPVSAPVQDPDAVIAAIKKMCGDCAKLVQAIDELVTQQDEKQLVAFDEAESQVADLAGDIEGANKRKDQAADMMALMDAARQ